MITASKIELAKHCPGAFALPHSDHKTAEAEAGKVRHKEWEDRINAGDVPEELTERWPGMTWRAEVKFAYDLATNKGRELGQGDDRDYSSAGTFDIPGTADVVGQSEALLVVVDRKGYGDGVSRAAVNAQVHIAALALSSAHGYQRAEVAIRHEVRPLDVAPLDLFDLEVFAAELRDIFDKAASERQMYRQGAIPILNEGSWCRWCPAYGSCPRKKSLALEIQSGAAENRIELLLPLGNDEAAAAAYDFAGRLRQMLKRLDAAIYARAAEKPIPLPNGMLLGKVQTMGNEKLDGDIVYETVKAMHGQAIADTAVVRTATKTRLREALGFVGGKGQVAAMERAVLAEVKAKGGVKREPKDVIEEYPAKQLKAVP